MSAGTHDIPLRSARDRIIDLLEIGDSYPLTDLNVVADQLKVAFGSIARIPIEGAQAGVTYELCGPKGDSLDPEIKAEGNDETLVIETPRVNEDLTYRIRATKEPLDSYFLDQSAPVKVGIDTGLAIEILNATPLDPEKSNPSDARIVPYGASVDVQVNMSQEGVQYSLILDGQDMGEVVIGDLHSIVLTTGPMHENAVFQVRATKTFLASEKRSAETSLLDARLYLHVMADPALTVSVEPTPIVDYRQDIIIRITNTEKDVKYRAYTRAIPDLDFIRGDAAGADVVTIPVSGHPDVQIRTPVRQERWQTPEGYVPIGEGPSLGTGGDIEITVSEVVDDSLVIIQALKAHQVEPNAPRPITSSIRLKQAAAILVRPDPARALRLSIPPVPIQTGDALQVSDGEPGVVYYFRPATTDDEYPLPVYFHKRDAQDTTQNKGLGQLGVEVDFVVVDDAVAASRVLSSPSTTFPPLPVLEITPVAIGSEFFVRALKAQTAVETMLETKRLVEKVGQEKVDPDA